MKGYNVILIYNCTGDKILMCKRRKEPFRGLYNLVGGKIEPGETGPAAACREMLEETSISAEHISLFHLMDFTYHTSGSCIEVYVGKLKTDVAVSGDENDLFWIESGSNFFDMDTFAGRGNIGHIVAQTNAWAEKIFPQ